MIPVSLSFYRQGFDGQPNPELSTLTVLPCVTWFHCLSRFHSSFYISHGFTNFERIFFSNSQLSKKTSKCSTIPCQKISQHGLFSSSIQNLPLKAALDIAVPWYCLELYRKHPWNINLIKVAFFSSIVFATIWTFFRTAIKYTYVEVLLKQAHYLNKKFVMLILIIFGWFF